MAYVVDQNDWEPQGVDSVEPAADRVIRSTKHTAVVAGPGSGKTELLAQRASYLLQTGLCPTPRRILAISFKVDAAKNLKERVRSRCSPELSNRFDSFTFDGFNMNLLVRCRTAVPEWCRPGPNFEPYVRGWKRDLKRFLREPPMYEAGSEDYDQLQEQEQDTFYNNHVLDILPLEGFSGETVPEEASAEWWKALLQADPSRLTFPMIARLTELLLRTSTSLNNAIRSTYSHVFLDEFQDVTFWQYDFLKTAFTDASAVLTAVGDHRQSIMKWAGAMDQPFEAFQSDFDAELAKLQRNYRSVSDLVGFQYNLAKLVDPSTERSTSKQEQEISEAVCSIWQFRTAEREASKVASYIKEKVETENLAADDFAIIVKQKSGDFAEVLKSAFEEQKIKVRDESAYQDVLSQSLTNVLTLFLRFGSAKAPGKYWVRCTSLMERLGSKITSGNPLESRRIRDQLSSFHDRLHPILSDRASCSRKNLEDILDIIIEFVGKNRFRANLQEYRRERDFSYAYERFLDTLAPLLDDHTDWNAALDEFEGRGITPVMTIHKSKGLEYHTVFFLAFEDKTWWTLKSRMPQPEREESLRALFVGFSRAEQRVIFTRCSGRSGWGELAHLYDELETAGANVEKFEY